LDMSRSHPMEPCCPIGRLHPIVTMLLQQGHVWDTGATSRHLREDRREPPNSSQEEHKGVNFGATNGVECNEMGAVDVFFGKDISFQHKHSKPWYLIPTATFLRGSKGNLGASLCGSQRCLLGLRLFLGFIL